MKLLAGEHDIDPRTFDFIELPELEAVERAVTSLVQHGALTSENERMTPLGRVLANLPISGVWSIPYHHWPFPSLPSGAERSGVPLGTSIVVACLLLL
jgi:hypothetical protein